MSAVLKGATPAPAARQWWREPMMWLVLGGPFIVIVAGVVTLVLAIRTPDPVVAADYYRQGLEINKTLAERETAAAAPVPPEALRPALQARNHSATPVEDR